MRVLVDGRSVLVACSVLPYSRAERDWGGLSGGQKEQFRLVLRHHLLRIAAERDPSDEPLIWGGDFNQQLIRPCGHGLMTSADELRSALEALGLTALTAGMADRDHLGYTIDHLAVSADWLADRVEVHRPTGSDGKNLSDHAAYTADVHLFRA